MVITTIYYSHDTYLIICNYKIYNVSNLNISHFKTLYVYICLNIMDKHISLNIMYYHINYATIYFI